MTKIYAEAYENAQANVERMTDVDLIAALAANMTVIECGGRSTHNLIYLAAFITQY